MSDLVAKICRPLSKNAKPLEVLSLREALPARSSRASSAGGE